MAQHVTQDIGVHVGHSEVDTSVGGQDDTLWISVAILFNVCSLVDNLVIIVDKSEDV